MTREQQKEILAIKDLILKNEFSKEDWKELGLTIGQYHKIKGHDRLLRSLHWGDDDYGSNILEILSEIIEIDKQNLGDIKAYLEKRFAPKTREEFISTPQVTPPIHTLTFAPGVFAVPQKAQQDNLVAVMLPFSLKETFAVLKSTCKSMGLDCIKADDIWENNTFVQDIFDLIFTSKVVIADFTGKNPNVFYEVGIAHTLGKTVIPITQSMADVPSDLGHHRILLYETHQKGYLELATEIQKRLSGIFPTDVTGFWLT